MALPNNASTFSNLGQTPNTDSVADVRPTSDVALAVGNLINQNQVAEGPSIPPIQQGQYRVPRPSGFGVQSITNAKPMGALIVFTWDDIQSFGSDVAEYRIFVHLAYDSNPEPTAVGSAQQSPCYVTVLSPQATSAVFTLRPYLANGQTLPLEECPTTTVNLPAPVFQFQSGNDIVYIDANRPQAGGSGSTTVETFDSSTSWTVPANVTSVTVECWGAGGSGGDAGTDGLFVYGGGGGGGGGYTTGTQAVTPGSVITISVAGGGSGLQTYFNTPFTLSANSGGNGTNLGVGGAAGTGATANGVAGANVSGGSGSTNNGGDGGAAGGGGGAGGAGGVNNVGNNGVAPGGGSGGGGYAFGVFYGGVAGANGRIKLTYTTSAGTSNAPGIGVVNSNGQLSSLTDLTILFINSSNKLTAALGTDSGTGFGFLELATGTGADTLIVSPGSATTATGGARALPANPAGFLLANLGGTAIKVPYYNA